MFIYKHKSNKLYVFLVFIFLLLIGGLYKIKATSLYRWRYKKEIKDLTQLPNEGIITGGK